MKIGPLSLEWRQKATPSVLSSIDQRGGWFPIIRESFDGAWQNNITVDTASVLTYVTVYACITLISSDIGKLRIKLVQQATDGTWDETTSPAFSPVLKNPNDFQNRLQFLENWVASKLISGNTYILKQRDERRIVTQLYILDPNRVKVLLSSDGAIYYQLATDTISGLPESVTVPASEIIHDRMCPLHHPLVGVSPITACGLAAIQGLRIQENSTLFFANGASPGGILSSEQVIKNDQATELKNRWEQNYGGANRGAVAVLGNGLKYQQLMMSAVDSQLIEQLRWTSETVCSAFHVPPFKVGVGPYPSYNNVEALDQQYYSQCLQTLIEHIEALLDKGLGLDMPKEGRTLGTELDLDGLLRMDSSTRMKTALEAMNAGMTPDEVRKRYHDLGPIEGGERVFLQRQNWPLEMLGSDVPPSPIAPKPPVADEPINTDDEAKSLAWMALEAQKTAIQYAAR